MSKYLEEGSVVGAECAGGRVAGDTTTGRMEQMGKGFLERC